MATYGHSYAFTSTNSHITPYWDSHRYTNSNTHANSNNNRNGCSVPCHRNTDPHINTFTYI
jgi:hypothetical protein